MTINRTKSELLEEIKELKEVNKKLNDLINHKENGTEHKKADKIEKIIKKHSELLQESAEILHAFTENSPDIIMRFDREHRHIFVNSVVESQTGIPVKSFLGKTHKEMGFPEYLVELWDEAIEKVFISGKSNRIEFKLPNNLWVDWLLIPEFSHGKIRSVITTARDITKIKESEAEIIKLNAELENRVAERTSQLEKINLELKEKIDQQKKTESILAREERRYRTLFNLSPSGIMIIDKTGNILEANNAFCNSLGYSREEIIKMQIYDIAHKDSLEHIKENIVKIMSGEILRHTVKNIRKDGSISYFELNETKYLLENDEETVLVVSNDITAKVYAEKKLKTSEERLRTLINATPDIVCFKDAEGKWLDTNRAYLKLFRLENLDYVGKRNSDLAEYSPFFKDTFDRCEESDEFTWNSKKIVKSDEVIKTPDGIEHIYEIMKIPLFHSNGFRKGMVILGRNITERKQFESELIKAKEEAEKSEKLKTEFLAQMSHEIRSPINIILSFTSLLKEELIGKLPKELEISFDSIDHGGKRIIRTIDQILNMSEIQTGSFETRLLHLNIEEDILQKCIKEFQTYAQMKSLQLNFQNKAGNTKVLADHYSVNQIFSNLIDNAIKYTPAGKIDVVLYKDHYDKICVDVQDTGIGISQDYLPNLFKPFSQEEGGIPEDMKETG